MYVKHTNMKGLFLEVKMKKALLVIVIVSSVLLLNASIFNIGKWFRNNKGIKNYHKGDFVKAEKNFNENAVKDPTDPRLQYNLGNAYYKNKKVDEALSAYQTALKNSKCENKDEVLMNVGNVFYNNKDYEKALESYKHALWENPDNEDVKVNYELAKEMLKQQQQQQQQKQDQNQEKNKKDNKEENKQQKQDKQEDKKEKEEQQMSQEEKEKQKEAEAQLKALQEQEQNDQKEKKKAIQNGRARGRWW